MIEITLDSTYVTHALNQLSQSITNMQPAMVEIGESEVSWVDLTFRDAEDPSGNPWADLSPITIANRINESRKQKVVGLEHYLLLIEILNGFFIWLPKKSTQ